MNPSPSGVERAPRGLGVKPLASLLAHPRIALASLLAVLLVGAPLAWIKGQPTFAASATVQVAPRFMKNLKDDSELDFQSNSQYRQFVEHQARSVARYDIVAAGMDAAAAQGHPWRRPDESPRRAVERLQERLVVAPVADTYLMRIALEGGARDGLAELVNAVVSAYVARMKDEMLFGADDRTRALVRREGELLEAIRTRSERRTTIALEVGVSTFAEGDGNPHDKLLLAARSAHDEAQRMRLAAEAKLGAYERTAETDIVTRSVQDNVLNDPGLNSLKASLNNRRAALASVMSGLTPDHPVHLSAKEELAEIDAEIARRSAELRGEVGTSLRARYDATVEQARRYEQDLARILREREARSARAATLYNEALGLASEIAQSRKELEAVRERLSFLDVEREALGFVRVVTPAMVPETAYGPGRRKLLLLVLLAALAAGAVAPVIVDLADRRVRAVGDAERALAMPALGWLVEGAGAAERLFAEDQVRRIAGALVRERERSGARAFALTAVKPGGGTSSLALRVARTLDAMGYPTLAVEANAFSPDPRYGSARPGIAQALRGDADPDDCVDEASDELPARVQAGVAAGDAHLGRVERLGGLLDAWSRRFEFVLVDAPPLLLAADAEIVLDRVGQALLVVEAGATTPGELARAARVLEAGGARAVGLVVNRVRVLEGGGYLRALLVEFLTRRKHADFASMPAWRLHVAARLGGRRLARPARTKGVPA